MTPCEQGRYCSHCRKQVIDFTTRAIHLLQQFYTSLHMMLVAMGLALVTAQPVVAQNRAPVKNDSARETPTSKEYRTKLATGELRGKVVGDKREPILSATIKVFQNGKLMGGNGTDPDGMYIVESLDPGYYDVICDFTGYDSIIHTKVVVSSNAVTLLNFNMQRKSYGLGSAGYMGGGSYFSRPERISDKKLQKERERKERKAARKNKGNEKDTI